MSDQTLSSSAQSTVSMLHSSTLSLLTILNALLDVSKVSAAKMTNCSQNFNLHDLVLDTARMMTGLSGTRTVELLVDFSAQVPELVRADPGIIKQVLGNLISNAIKVPPSPLYQLLLSLHCFILLAFRINTPLFLNLFLIHTSSPMSVM